MRNSAPRSPMADGRARCTAATDARFGDYQTNVAMILAKQQRANPRQLAQQIIDKLDVAEMCAPPEIAGAGFINFRLKPGMARARVSPQLAADPRLGVPAPAAPKSSSSTSARRTSPSRCTSATSARRSSAMRSPASPTSSATPSCATTTSATGARSSACCSSAGRRSSIATALAADPLGEMERIYKLDQRAVQRRPRHARTRARRNS